ncbi:flippase [Scheffersomyces coipomensis]|uniref:flippase n=1 Tax=Scheffersomyces coipomensis TaxID=1788519 RepID=UPI00315CA18D
MSDHTSLQTSDDKAGSDDKENVSIGGSVGGASLLMAVQIITKLFTFALNQYLIQFISPNVFGISAYLEFLISSILFFSREGIRIAIQKLSLTDPVTDENKDEVDHLSKVGLNQSIINKGFLPLIVGIPITILIGIWQYNSHSFETGLQQLNYHHYTILITVISIFVELAIEPIYVLNQFLLNIKRRSQIEGLAVFFRCVIIVGIILVINKFELLEDDFTGVAVLAFALGQLAYSLVLAVGYLSVFIWENKRGDNEKLQLKIQRIFYKSEKSLYFHPKALKTWKNLFLQMIFKQMLTEGDKMLVNYFFSVKQQGIYSVMSNYGSILARLVFQPIEETVRLSFSKSLSALDCNINEVKQSYKSLKLISLLYFNLSILILLAGTTNASYLLTIILGRGGSSKWVGSEIFSLFPTYISYLPLLAFNGIFEALFSSLATDKDIRQSSVFMTSLTISSLLLSVVLIEYFHLGLTGLIVSNAFNMASRITYCASKITAFYSSFGIQVSIWKIINYLKSSILVAAIFAFVQYKFVLKGEGLSTKSHLQFFESCLVALLCLISLLLLELKSIKETIGARRSKVKSL